MSRSSHVCSWLSSCCIYSLLFNHSEAFKMNTDQPVSLFPLNSAHGWRGWLTGVCVYKERRHFLYKWFQSGKICFRNQSPEVANACSESNLENVVCLMSLFLSFDTVQNWWKRMKLSFHLFCSCQPDLSLCLSCSGHRQYTHLQVWTSWGYFSWKTYQKCIRNLLISCLAMKW